LAFDGVQLGVRREINRQINPTDRRFAFDLAEFLDDAPSFRSAFRCTNARQVFRPNLNKGQRQRLRACAANLDVVIVILQEVGEQTGAPILDEKRAPTDDLPGAGLFLCAARLRERLQPRQIRRRFLCVTTGERQLQEVDSLPQRAEEVISVSFRCSVRRRRIGASGAGRLRRSGPA
jgi:hypothetical protein